MLETKNDNQILPEKQLPSGPVVGRWLRDLCGCLGHARGRTAPRGQLYLGRFRWGLVSCFQLGRDSASD